MEMRERSQILVEYIYMHNQQKPAFVTRTHFSTPYQLFSTPRDRGSVTLVSSLNQTENNIESVFGPPSSLPIIVVPSSSSPFWLSRSQIRQHLNALMSVNIMAPRLLYHGRLLSMTSAAEDESNLVLYIRHQRAAETFRRLLWDQRESIVALVRAHLHLRKDDGCVVLPPESWLQGGFNLCVLVEVTVAGSSTSLVFRCPMPHKLAEGQYPGTIDEKVRCEVAAYVWMQEHCSDIRIPSLYAFGFVDGSQ